MILKSISTMNESRRRAAMVKLSKMIEEGRSITDISSELHIPESEIQDAIDWVKNVKNR